MPFTFIGVFEEAMWSCALGSILAWYVPHLCLDVCTLVFFGVPVEATVTVQTPPMQEVWKADALKWAWGGRPCGHWCCCLVAIEVVILPFGSFCNGVLSGLWCWVALEVVILR